MSLSSKLEAEYRSTHKTSEKIHQRAVQVMPTGIETDARYLMPFPFYIQRAEKARKWDVDGNEYLDAWSGHGALILGHNHPKVVAAVQEQAKKGFHYSSCHETQVEMAELMVKLIPCAEKIRYIQSGAEANALAIRVARAYTGKNKFIKFRGHFHGYFDEGVMAIRPPFDVPMSIGVPQASLSNVLLARHNHSEDVQCLIDGAANDVACVIIDPSGAHNLVLGNKSGFLEEVRRITQEKKVILIFDEVVSGFRLAPGGAQEVLGVTPDLATVAKPMGGGLPASALVGRRDIMDTMTMTGDRDHDRFHRVISQGTHSGNPMAMAAGLATLKLLENGEPQKYINRLGKILRKSLNEVIKKHDVPGCAYGNWSIVHIFLGEECPIRRDCDRTTCLHPDHEKLDLYGSVKVRSNLRMAMLLNGVDYLGGFGLMFLNAAMTDQDIEKITNSFDLSLKRLKEEKIL